MRPNILVIAGHDPSGGAGIHADMVATYQRDLKSAVELLSTGEAPRIQKLDELDLVAWTAMANVMLNLDETITRE